MRSWDDVGTQLLCRHPDASSRWLRVNRGPDRGFRTKSAMSSPWGGRVPFVPIRNEAVGVLEPVRGSA